MTSSSQSDSRHGPRTALAGVRVVDTSQGIAGSLAAALLADFGAEVIKVEPPGGEPARQAPGFAVWNRGKAGVVLDLEQRVDRQRLQELLSDADVWVGADRVSQHHGLDPDDASHPRLVMLDAPPYPVPVPWAGGHESNGLLAAATGIALRQSSHRGGPVDHVYPHLLYVHGVWAAACVVAALVERERSGLGQRLTVHGVHGMMVAATGFLAFDPDHLEPPPAVGPGGPNPFYTRYRCADGSWLFLGSLTPKFQLRALRALDLEHLLTHSDIAGALERMLLVEHRDRIRRHFAEAFETRSREDWLERLARAGCPAGALKQREAWLDHPQIRAIGMRMEVDDPDRGRVEMPGVPVRLSATPGAVSGPAPQLADRASSTRVGFSGSQRPVAASHGPRSSRRSGEHCPAVESSRNGRGPLAGTRVLDLGMILAGPYTGHLLAELGCEVIKVEPPAGDSFRTLGFTYNRGMRSLALDLRKADGRDAFQRLVAQSDVVIENYRAAVAERLGVTAEVLQGARADIISVGIRGFGDTGPLADDPGFDPILQAVSGMMTAQGGDDEPVLITVPYIDVTTAVLSVLGVCLALFHRTRHGEGQHVATSLAAASLLLQSGEVVRYEARQPAHRGGADFLGPASTDRFYEAKDGWIRLAAEPHTGATINGLSDEEQLQRRLRELTGEQAVAWLTAHGVAAVRARRHDEIVRDPRLLAEEVVHWHRRPDGTGYYTAGRYARFSRTQAHAVFTAPGIGEHSRGVLREAGFSAREIQDLVDRGAVQAGDPMAHPDFGVLYR